MAPDDHHLRFPVGPFVPVPAPTPETRAAAIADIVALPARVRAAVSSLSDAQLDTPYRSGGWTARQVVHHLADSHMNGFIRVKLALTETHPTIKPYDQDAWAGLPDSALPVEVSVRLLDVLHTRWAVVYTSMAESQFSRTFVHPEAGIVYTLSEHLQLYAWHSRHHVAHIAELRRRQGW